MLELIEANWIIFILALLIGLIVAWWIFARGSTVAKPRERRPDALDEGAAPARRNQALIDAPPAAKIEPPAHVGTMAGIGEVIAVAAQDEVEQSEAARAHTDLKQTVAASQDAAFDEPAQTQPVAPPPPAASGRTGDDLRAIKGVGPKLAALLHSLGVNSYAQIAAWDEAEIDRIDAQLGTFAGRIRRDNWVEQARLLSGGDTAAYEAQFGKL